VLCEVNEIWAGNPGPRSAVKPMRIGPGLRSEKLTKAHLPCRSRIGNTEEKNLISFIVDTRFEQNNSLRTRVRGRIIVQLHDKT
jgi:hypothetical protein